MPPAFWFFLGTLIGAAVCSTVETYLRRRVFDALDASYRAEAAEVDALFMRQLAARDATIRLLKTLKTTTPTRGPGLGSES